MSNSFLGKQKKTLRYIFNFNINFILFEYIQPQISEIYILTPKGIQ